MKTNRHLYTKYFLCFVFLLGFTVIVNAQLIGPFPYSHPVNQTRSTSNKVNILEHHTSPKDSIIPANPKRLNGGQSVTPNGNNDTTMPVKEKLTREQQDAEKPD